MTDADTRHARVRPRRDTRNTRNTCVPRAAHSESRRAWLAGACASVAALAALAAGSTAGFAGTAASSSTSSSPSSSSLADASTPASNGAAVGSSGTAPASAARATPAQADTQPPSGGGLDAFVALSQKLTGRSSFNSVLAKRAYDALSKADNQFMQNVATLNTWLHTHGGVPSDMVIAALQTDTPALAKTAAAIVRAWYLGLVGELPNVRVIAYESALMFDPVNDVLTVPSYCRDVPFYWSQKPTNA
ncbi:sorbitol dehydrogenase family protein [Paraburkholderia edwinii]|uniref:Sorbitol dehydrogenase family protein n=1 Tax=Paraburkholderia edwinii TaxID=2861782 RepID=A0ABX8UTM2_9BURK|nr:sorbitol dehydrogenase family protein [Paraburkholderia edwinii]QYD72347.1 sorbitol dehydrogenase family protein [Paraburkholderia edwinii]